MPVVTGKAMWAKLDKPDSESNKYEITVTQLSKEDAKRLTAEGVGVRDGKTEENEKLRDYGLFAKFRSKYPVSVIDKDRDPMLDVSKVGNGSVVTVQYKPREWEFKFKTGTTFDLQGVRVDELVEYGGSGTNEL